MKGKQIKRTFVLISVISIVLLSAIPGVSKDSKEPIKIGVMSSLSGFFASFAPYMTTGVQMVVDDVNKSGGLLGRQVEIVVEDDMADPSHVPTAAAALKSKGVIAIVGTFMDACNSALFQWGNDNKMIIAGADDTVLDNRTKRFSKYVFFQCPPATISGKIFAQYAKDHNIKSVYFINGDVLITHLVTESFLAEIKELDPSVVNLGMHWSGITETDYTNIISAALAKKPDMVVLGLGGPAFAAFVQQARQFQFFNKVKIVASPLMLGGENTVMFGKNYPTDLLVTMTAPFWLDTPEMKAFTNEFYKRTKLYPGELTMDFYMATLALVEAIKKASSTDPDKIIKAWEKLTLKNTPLGTIHYRDFDHQANSPTWLGTSGYSPQYPVAIGKNLKKYQDDIYPTKTEILKLRKLK